MKLLSFRVNNETRLGLLVNSSIVDVARGCDQLFGEKVPSDMLIFLEDGEATMVKARNLEEVAKTSLKTMHSASDAVFDVGEVEVLAPIPRTRKNIICLGLNYVEHSQEVGLPLPKYPIFFTKPPTSIIGPEAPVLFPKSTSKVDYEAELAFIFGKKGKDVSEEDAFNYVAGYTVFNDITARDLQGKHGQWFKGKGLDTFSSIGPYVVTKDEVPNPHNLEISLELNGRLMQKSNTRNMLFKIPALVKYITMDMTVEPGDVVATGTPSGVGYTRKPPVYLKPGDVMKVSVEKVGVLQNTVVSQ
jgi:2-keto-4-pentenoate hydratase/2-oxohepta-3-ene-1,7-dioic acid hydratase in catechol pathway